MSKNFEYVEDEIKLIPSIKLQSDAFPKYCSNSQSEISEIHKKISEIKNFKPNHEFLSFKKLKWENLNEIISLHKEWFPVQYSRNYFENFLENDTETKNDNYSPTGIGGFITINGKEYLVGNRN